MKNVITMLCLLLITTAASAQKINKIQDVKDPSGINVEGENLFITEEGYFTIYSLADKKMIKKTGEKGDGPGQFKYGPDIIVFPDKVFANSYVKCSWISSEGKFIKEKSYSDFENFNSSSELKFVPAGENYVRRIVNHDNAKQIIHLVGPDFKEIKKLGEGYYDFNKLPRDIPNYKLLLHYMGIAVYDNKIFIGDSKDGFKIDVFDLKGEHLYSIDKEYEKTAPSDEFKKTVEEGLKNSQPGLYRYISSQNAKFTFYENYPPFRYFLISNDKIYVKTYNTKEGKHEIIILDLKGKTLDKIYLPLISYKIFKFTGQTDLYSISNDKLYELVKNDETKTWELHVTEIK